MAIMSLMLGGIPLWIWLILFIGILLCIVALLVSGNNNQIEKLKGWVLKKRHPERVIKVIVHYKSGMYKVFWRLIPEKNVIRIDKKDYIYDEIDVIKPQGILEKDNIVLNLDDKAYIQERGTKYPEIHYVFNVPFPLRFDFTEKDEKIKFSSHSLKEFKENDLFEKLLRLKGEKGIMMFMMMMILLNVAITGFLLAKQMGWLE